MGHYCSEKLTCACSILSVHAHGTEAEVENSRILKLWQNVPGDLRFATDSQGYIQMSVIQEKGCFPKCGLLLVILPVV